MLSIYHPISFLYETGKCVSQTNSKYVLQALPRMITLWLAFTNSGTAATSSTAGPVKSKKGSASNAGDLQFLTCLK